MYNMSIIISDLFQSCCCRFQLFIKSEIKTVPDNTYKHKCNFFNKLLSKLVFFTVTRSRGYKTFFMLNLAETKSYPAHK